MSENWDYYVCHVSHASVKLQYVGRKTGGGCRDYICYGEEGPAAESALSAAMTAFPNFRYEVGSRQDHEWEIYREFLYPDARQRLTMRNDHLLRRLNELQDCFAVPREVRHWAYFPSAETRNAFREIVVRRGFQLDSETDADQGAMPHGITLKLHHSVDMPTVNDITLGLYDLACELSGEYDGWETPVIKSTDVSALNPEP